MDKNIRHNYNCYDSTTNYFLIIAVNCGVALLTAIMFMIVAGAIKMPYEQFIGTQGAIFASIVITPITYLGIYFVYHKRNQIKMFSKPQINVWYVLLAVAFGLICIFAVAPITNWLVYLFQKLGLKLDASLGFEMNTWWKIVLGIILSILGAPPIAFAYPVYNTMIRRGKQKYGEEIVRLSDEILGE